VATSAALPGRIDFAVATSGVVVTKLWLIEGRNVALHGAQTKPADFDLDGALAWCEANGYTVRRWQGGARAWRDDEPRPIRTRLQIWRRRARAEQLALHGDPAACALSCDFAYDG
jgi:hypothetical protein